MDWQPSGFLPLRTVEVASNPNRLRLLESHAALRTPGSRVSLLRLDGSADRPREVLLRARCDYCIRDGPLRCGCMLSYGHVENLFSRGAARKVEGHAALCHNR